MYVCVYIRTITHPTLFNKVETYKISEQTQYTYLCNVTHMEYGYINFKKCITTITKYKINNN